MQAPLYALQLSVKQHMPEKIKESGLRWINCPEHAATCPYISLNVNNLVSSPSEYELLCNYDANKT